MGVWGFRLSIIIAAGVLLYLVPLIRVTDIAATDSAGAFDHVAFAESFWEERLIPATAGAASATQVVADLAKDAAKAGETHGRRLGVSRGYLLFVQGTGAIDSSDDRGVLVKLDGGGEVRLSKRKVFGSIIRDATGLLKNDEAPGSREYNLVASELNRLATEKAIVRIAEATPGSRLRFAGCAKIVSPASYQPPLEVIPVLVEPVE